MNQFLWFCTVITLDRVKKIDIFRSLETHGLSNAINVTLTLDTLSRNTKLEDSCLRDLSSVHGLVLGGMSTTQQIDIFLRNMHGLVTESTGEDVVAMSITAYNGGD